jgi:methyl-accepting chemotaxis protein
MALVGLIIGLSVFYQRINTSLSAALIQIRESVARLAVAAEQFGAGARRVATGAENQSSAIQQISSTMDEVSATARSNAETARQSESTTSTADAAAGGVSQAVERLGKTMGQIREAATESAGVVLAIDEIAFQTKILAVNAAIEAARSGRANSGFSVLSEEIRSLAQQSVEAARRTGDRLRDSQEHSQVGEEVVREVAQSIAQVLSAVQSASRMAAAVSQSSNEQVRGVDQVNKSIAELNRTVQSNAAEADETLATSASLRDQAGRLGELVGRLEAMVGKRAR